MSCEGQGSYQGQLLAVTFCSPSHREGLVDSQTNVCVVKGFFFLIDFILEE